ncbi:succinylglutamate desuccinylase/aspartoacylase family protein [Mesorhizobium sp. CU2]|uniref:succinylglutamate desuccinylase/aspartoacylase domain-containing protein n=1 Tax=unclassified Mesorhizobium TaxID=325217 RepID=UPI00112C40C2|nr:MULTISPECIES: succinylglutamate desuccinylase/aspartoacylase family protein [unclassified Mesorhizobium]TPN82509.1 succinylglutamate desuccinylase/aspartoacylase family protein [Mesorhizobium sp. CU3]TPO13560.1 succinylglutamate desuccinylase/aspartoacylase family protein [Mesorhizobium sp. CU2]
MQKTIERIAGDSDGTAYEFPVFRFDGTDKAAPSAYLQAALHAGELPGVVAIDALMPMLAKAEAEKRIRGAITIVPWANPIGRSQYHFGEHQGRFHLGTRVNFNRGFPLLAAPDARLLPDTSLGGADQRLKTRLVQLSLGRDIVLDLHCDDEGLPYLYIHTSLWPHMADCAAAMGIDAVVLWSEDTDGTFEGASIMPYQNVPASVARFERRAVTTVEYRGMLDVNGAYAASDAAGLYRLLVTRGVVQDSSIPKFEKFAGPVVPLENIDMMPSPKAGAILYDVKPGDRVAKGDRLATIVHAPGEAGGRTEVFAPQSGFILTRRSRRIIRAGEDLLKLAGDKRSGDARSGTLED